MRDRCLSRLCRSGRAPMARRQDVCCGARRLPDGVIPLRPGARPARAEARLQIDRWTGESGSVGSEPVAAAG